MKPKLKPTGSILVEQVYSVLVGSTKSGSTYAGSKRGTSLVNQLVSNGSQARFMCLLDLGIYEIFSAPGK